MYGTPEKNNKVGIRYAYRHVSGNPFNTGVIIRDESNISDEAPCLTSLKAVGREPVLFLQVMFYRGALNQICPAQGGTVCQYLQTHYFFGGNGVCYILYYTRHCILHLRILSRL
jgi:hypothetical protein